MGKKVKLEIKRSQCERYEQNVTHIDRSEPFAMSQAGTLIHRVRFRRLFKHEPGGAWQTGSHEAVTYWCGGSVCSPVLLFDIPAGRMVCAKCEERLAGTTAGRLSKHKRAADIVGRTVKLGAMVPVQVGVQKVSKP